MFMITTRDFCSVSRRSGCPTSHRRRDGKIAPHRRHDESVQFKLPSCGSPCQRVFYITCVALPLVVCLQPLIKRLPSVPLKSLDGVEGPTRSPGPTRLPRGCRKLRDAQNQMQIIQNKYKQYNNTNSLFSTI